MRGDGRVKGKKIDITIMIIASIFTVNIGYSYFNSKVEMKNKNNKSINKIGKFPTRLKPISKTTEITNIENFISMEEVLRYINEAQYYIDSFRDISLALQ